MKNLVVLSGAGISKESGIDTFRDANGLWEQYDVMEVASIQGWEANPELVLKFYNKRRKQLKEVEPNKAHKIIAKLEAKFNIQIITQNVDNLHERAASTDILHLHGELTKVRSTKDPSLIYDIGNKEIKIGDKCEKGYQLRPHIVWFGEDVPKMIEAVEIVNKADILVIIGTSLNVYPAASLITFAKENADIYLIDPNETQLPEEYKNKVKIIKEVASKGMIALEKFI